MPNPRLLINLFKKLGKVKGTGVLKKVPKEIPYQKWATESLDPNLAKRVQFDGIQEKIFRLPKGKIAIKPGFYQFTDKKTGSTFLVPLEEDLNFGVWQRLDKLEKSFGGKP